MNQCSFGLIGGHVQGEYIVQGNQILSVMNITLHAVLNLVSCLLWKWLKEKIDPGNKDRLSFQSTVRLLV